MGCSCLRGEGNHPITKGEKPGPKPAGDGLYSSALGEGEVAKVEPIRSEPQFRIAKWKAHEDTSLGRDDRIVGEPQAPINAYKKHGKEGHEGKDHETDKHVVHFKEGDEADYKEGNYGASNPNAKGGDLERSEKVVVHPVTGLD
mmetsp:Transcript_3755/g.8013  ORF Transcript_3755/g.8013 Transcript_3755/m.8013 type:complete len:144 (+) Transcript_3755:240-671(+)|eukprot:CAMPEP_0204902116 /NCGR_PEP_ID=MMETSP1397-20131031/3476_1 /ASSEMBLY_ACC=CAM_ASM_000891 /TAXON_ID=49980 /ORGANISM="Climacostomum Climacostomum virens, Strain Stock W-24" /LENGTH=143 /DNA_ID=CAMNT_0052070573 /DNA_START=22 /DNA_END=453 /DNA_ORIENTATION=+